MKKRRFDFIKCAVLAVVILMSSSGILAAPDVLIDLRLYKGSREKENAAPTVVTSYYLKPISSAGKILDVDLATLEKILGRRVVKAARRQRRREAADLERQALCDDLERITTTGGGTQRGDLYAKSASKGSKYEHNSKTGGFLDGQTWRTETEADEVTFTGKHLSSGST